MAKIFYNKLVRDRILEIIAKDGKRVHTHTLSKEELIPALLQKLSEEIEELATAPAEKRAEELADILEVLKALAEARNISWAKIEANQEQKREKRGGFSQRIFLEYIE